MLEKMHQTEKIRKIPFYIKLIFVLFAIKVALFNHLTEIKGQRILLFFISSIYLFSLFMIINQVAGSKKKLLSVAVYWLVSMIMCYDCLYFQYFNQLPSFHVLKQIKQVNSVFGSIQYFLKPIYFLFLIDLLPVSIYLYFKREPSSSYNISGRFDYRILLISILLFFVPYTAVYSINKDYAVKISKQEIFTYHFKDLANNLFGKLGFKNYTKDSLIASYNDRQKISENKSKYFGLAKNRNVIIVQVESLQNFPINRFYEGQEITPCLNRLIQNDSIYFDNYYQQLGRGNTSDAEFVTNNSLYPAMNGITYEIYADNTYYGLPWILKEQGYSTIVFHGYKPSFWNREVAYPNQGFDRFISQKDFIMHEEPIGLGLNDKDFFKQAVSYLSGVQKPFYSFLITLSNHHPYQLPEKYKSLKLKEEHEDTIFGKYLESVRYTDEAIEMFIGELKNAGLYENSIIVIYGDHHGIIVKDKEGNKLVSEFLGRQYDFDEMMKIPLIFHIPGGYVQEKSSIVGGQIDFLPTLLNLMGLQNEKGIMFGRDLNNSEDGFVAQQTYMIKGSFFTEDIVLEMSRDGIYENSRAWDPKTGNNVDLEICREYYKKALEEIDQSNYILERNFMPKIIQERKKEIK